MATFTARTITSTRREWVVPAPEPWGACIGDINAACAAACRAYREHYDLPEGAVLADDALRFRVGDDEIVIGFTVEGEAA